MVFLCAPLSSSARDAAVSPSRCVLCGLLSAPAGQPLAAVF